MALVLSSHVWMPNWNMYYLIHVLWKLNTKNIFYSICTIPSLRWRHNGCDIVSNHQPHGCLLNRLFRRRSKKTSKLRVTGLCSGNSPGTGEFPAQMASNAENSWVVKAAIAANHSRIVSFGMVALWTNRNVLRMGHKLRLCQKALICINPRWPPLAGLEF